MIKLSLQNDVDSMVHLRMNLVRAEQRRARRTDIIPPKSFSCQGRFSRKMKGGLSGRQSPLQALPPAGAQVHKKRTIEKNPLLW